MHLVAKVFGLDITDNEVLNECAKMSAEDSAETRSLALNRLIDAYLLLHQALLTGFSATEEEFDSALLETLEDIESAPRDEEQTRSLEERIRRKIITRKYVKQSCSQDIEISDEQLKAFYEDQKEVFSAPETVRASHILIRADVPDAEQKAREIRALLKTPADFMAVCSSRSDCPSGVRLGDLGYFPKGRMIKEIDAVAFSLEPHQISDVFQSRFGFHILMLTDRKASHIVPFEDIKDSLKARLIQLEREYLLVAHVNELRRNFQDQILILDPDYILSN